MNAVVSEMNATVAGALVPTPAQMLQTALEKGADMAQLEKLLDLQERWERNNARKAFVAAMAAFKAEPSVILKSKRADIPGGAKYSYATLADVVDGVAANLSKHGLSHRWETSQEGGKISVRCILTHEDGHSESAYLEALPDNSGKKNDIQQLASTVTYLERYTLMAACGLSAKDMQDDDGRGARRQNGAPAPDGYENWKADMRAKVDEGSLALQEAWKSTGAEIRRYVVKFDETWWCEMKALAAKVAS